MKQTKILVPADVLEGLEAVRLSGKTNMLDVPVIIRLALDMGFPEAALWVRGNRGLYAQGVFNGFKATDRLYADVLREMAERMVEQEGSDEQCADR